MIIPYLSKPVFWIILGLGGGVAFSLYTQDTLTQKALNPDYIANDRIQNTPSSSVGSSPANPMNRTITDRFRPSVQNTKQLVLDETIKDSLPILHQYVLTLTPDQLMSEVILLVTQNGTWSLNPHDEIRLEMMLTRLGEIAPKQALEMAKKMGEPHVYLLGTIMKSWTAKDPENAAVYVTSLINAESKHTLNDNLSYCRSLVSEWGKQDLKSALQWLSDQKLINDFHKKRCVELALASADTKMLETTLHDAKLLKSNPELVPLLQAHLIKQLSETNWTVAIEQIETITDTQTKDLAYQKALENLAKTNPKEAQKYFNNLTSNEQKRVVSESIFYALIADDFKEAADWYSQSKLVPPYVLRNLLSPWTKENPQASYEWIAQLPSDYHKDNAIREYKNATIEGNHERILNLMSQRSNEGFISNRDIQSQLKKWNTAQPEAAKSWLEQSKLQPDLKERLKDSIKNSPQ